MRWSTVILQLLRNAVLFFVLGLLARVLIRCLA